MLDLEEKKLKIIVILATLIGILIYYFYPKDEYEMEMIKPSRPPIQKVEEIKELPKQEKEKVTKVEVEAKKVEEEKQIIKRGNILFSSTDSSKRYDIQLINNVDIEVKNKNVTRYVPIIAEIEENSNISGFTTSISEDYLPYLNQLSIKIIDSTNDERIIETASYFLGALDLDSSYKIKLNINGDTLDGEVINSDKLPENILKEIENTEQKIVNTDDEKSEKEN